MASPDFIKALLDTVAAPSGDEVSMRRIPSKKLERLRASLARKAGKTVEEFDKEQWEIHSRSTGEKIHEARYGRAECPCFACVSRRKDYEEYLKKKIKS